MRKNKKISRTVVSLLLVIAISLTACSAAPKSEPASAPTDAAAPADAETPAATEASVAAEASVAPEAPGDSEVPSDTEQQQQKIPKYIFLFIGDGMSFPQVTALGHYNGTLEHNFVGTLEEPTPENVPQAEMPSFTEFPVVGAVTTYDASKFVTDSASAATAIACGVKTLDGAIGVDSFNNRVTSVAEILRDKGYKIGIVSSVSIDHATPAGFYAHVPHRGAYYDIGLDLIASEFDFFGGGGFLSPTGADNDQTDLLELAKNAGYKVVNTYDEINALDSSSGKTIAINQVLDAAQSLVYDIDRDNANDFKLSNYVQKAIDVLDNDNGFFIMAEGGKVDWAGHANDAFTAILEVKDLDNAVSVAVEFANKHPDETLILVTGDHETGGLSVGYNGTGYDSFLKLLDKQKHSFQIFVDQYITPYRENKTPFEKAMLDVKDLFGLVMPDDPDAATADPALVLTEREVEELREAYALTMIPYADREKDYDYLDLYSMYGYEPFQLVIVQIFNGRAGLGWTSTLHTGLPVAVYAMGAGSENFGDFYDNTEIVPKLLNLLGIAQ